MQHQPETSQAEKQSPVKLRPGAIGQQPGANHQRSCHGLASLTTTPQAAQSRNPSFRLVASSSVTHFLLELPWKMAQFLFSFRECSVQASTAIDQRGRTHSLTAESQVSDH